MSALAHSATTLCACGVPLLRLAGARGRRRRSCSPACKRRRDQTMRKVERRRAWIALWLVSHDEPEHVAAAVADLESDIGELLAAVSTGDAVGELTHAEP